MATTICCLANTIGVIVGFMLPSFFYSSSDKMSEETFKENTKLFLLVNSIISGVLCVPIIFFKEKPHIPPALSQMNKIKIQFCESIKILFRNKSFIMLLICSSSTIAFFCVYGTVLNLVFDQYKITSNQTSMLGTLANISGLLGSLIMGLIVDKFKIYKKMLLCLVGLCMTLHFLMTLLIELFNADAYYYLLVFWTLINFCVVPVYTITMDFVCELTYPIG